MSVKVRNHEDQCRPRRLKLVAAMGLLLCLASALSGCRERPKDAKGTKPTRVSTPPRQPRLAWSLRGDDVRDWPGLCSKLAQGASDGAAGPSRRVWQLLPPQARLAVQDVAQRTSDDGKHITGILAALNSLLERRDFYRTDDFWHVLLADEARKAFEARPDPLLDEDVQRLNCLLLEASYPQEISKNPRLRLERGRVYLVLYRTALSAQRDLCRLCMADPKMRVPMLAHYYAGIAEFQAGDWSAARLHFDKISAASDAGPILRGLAAAWVAGCDLKVPSTSAAEEFAQNFEQEHRRVQSEVGRILALFPHGAHCGEAIAKRALAEADEGDPKALGPYLRNAAIASIAAGHVREATLLLQRLEPRMPEAVADLGQIEFTDRTVQINWELYEPSTLQAFAKAEFLTAATECEDLWQDRAPGHRKWAILLARARQLLGQHEEAVQVLKQVLPELAQGAGERDAAMARLGQSYYALGRSQEARDAWAEVKARPGAESRRCLIQTWNEIGPQLDIETLREGVALCRSLMARLLRREPGLSPRRFRTKFFGDHAEQMWSLFSLGVRAQAGENQDGVDYLRASEELARLLYSPTWKYHMARFGPLFLARLGQIYYFLGQTQSNQYYEDMLRYMYDPSMLPEAFPGSWQIRKQVKQVCVAQESLPQVSVDPDSVRSRTPDMMSIMYGESARPQRSAVATAGHAEAAHDMPRWVVVSTGVVIVLVLPTLWLLRRKRHGS